jgi:hypothetical protein
MGDWMSLIPACRDALGQWYGHPGTAALRAEDNTPWTARSCYEISE